MVGTSVRPEAGLTLAPEAAFYRGLAPTPPNLCAARWLAFAYAKDHVQKPSGLLSRLPIFFLLFITKM